MLIYQNELEDFGRKYANREDPDQTATSEAVWSGSALYVYCLVRKAFCGQLVFRILEHLLYAKFRAIYMFDSGDYS